MRKAPPRLRAVGSQNRADARVVLVPLFGQDIERPEVVRLEPGVGDAISEDPMAACPFECFARARQVVAEFGRCELADVAMIVPLARHLVAARRHEPDKLGHGVGDPAEHEERRARLKLIEQVERADRAAFDATLEPVPLAALDQRD